MYCPQCFSNSLRLNSRGVVKLTINGKQMDTGRFLFNLDTEAMEEIQEKLRDKIEEFFKYRDGDNNRS